MRVTILLVALVLTGCGTTSTMAELKREAMASGDWSAVERRERMNARRAARRGAQCPDGLIGYCRTSFGRGRCQCIASDVLRDAFAGRF